MIFKLIKITNIKIKNKVKNKLKNKVKNKVKKLNISNYGLVHSML